MVLYKPATQIDCPHYDERPDESDVSVLVIHNISLPPSQFGTSGIRELFTGTLNPDEHPFYKEIAGIRVSYRHFKVALVVTTLPLVLN